MLKKGPSLALAGALLLVSTNALARGTPAGTSIVNQASVSYQVNSAVVTQESNTVDIRVAELLDLTLSWQDSANVVVKPGETDRMLTFLLANTGNGSESILLDLDNGVTVGDDFDPLAPSAIYLDTNGNASYDSGIDAPYDPTSNVPDLAPDASLTLFVFNAMPADPGGPADGALAISRLSAAAKSGSGAPGTVLPGKGFDGSLAAVVGGSGAAASADGLYQASRIDLAVTKSATVSDTFGGSEPLPGATIHYTIAVTVAGSGAASAVTVSDPVPADTTYTDGTLALDGVEISEAADADIGEVTESPPGSGDYLITVRLGDLTGPANHTITFAVTID